MKQGFHRHNRQRFIDPLKSVDPKISNQGFTLHHLRIRIPITLASCENRTEVARSSRRSKFEFCRLTGRFRRQAFVSR